MVATTGMGYKGMFSLGLTAMELASPMLSRVKGVTSFIHPQNLESAAKVAGMTNRAMSLHGRAAEIVKPENTHLDNADHTIGMMATAAGLGATAVEFFGGPAVVQTALGVSAPWLGAAATAVSFANIGYKMAYGS